MIWIIYLICICIILHDKRTIIPVFLIASMWINFDVRCGPLSFISMLSIFIVIYGFITRKKNLRFETDLDKTIYGYCLYMMIIYVPFMIFGTDLSLLYQTNSIKSNILNFILLIVLWKLNISNIASIKKQWTWIGVSMGVLCLYGIYTYWSKTNPYMDEMAQYCTTEDLSELLARSMEDARGNLSGRITGTSLYTIQYAIMLVIFFWGGLVYKPFFHKKYFYLIIILALINIYLTGSRGPLAGLLIGIILYLMQVLKPSRQIMYICLFSVFLLFGWPYVESYISLFSDKDIQGSSVEMRFAQFGAALAMVADNIQSLLFGKGLGYTAFYISNYGPHPVALYFESSHVSGIVNYGILGLLFIFIGNIYFLLRISLKALRRKMISKNSFYILASFLLSYFIYNLLVGSVYNNLFIIMFFITLKICIYKYRQVKNVKPIHKIVTNA